MGTQPICKEYLRNTSSATENISHTVRNTKLNKNVSTVNNHTGFPPSISYQQLTRVSVKLMFLQTCKDCLGSCDGCDSCNLCKLCPEGLSICAKCKYCKNGAEGCKKSCTRGKKEPVCKKCIENCS